MDVAVVSGLVVIGTFTGVLIRGNVGELGGGR